MNRTDSHDRMRTAGPPLVGDLELGRRLDPTARLAAELAVTRAMVDALQVELLERLGPCRVSVCRLHKAHHGPCALPRKAA